MGGGTAGEGFPHPRLYFCWDSPYLSRPVPKALRVG
jgi:hypothetical protein